MPKCSGCSGRCQCVIIGDGVTGSGSEYDPFVITSEGGGSGSNPAGSILMFGGASAPAGYLLCNGAAVSRSVYATLFGVVGTLYGPGDGSTTFNLPDLAGRFPLGGDSTHALGSQGGAETRVLTVSQLPAHSHSINHTHSNGTAASAGAHVHTHAWREDAAGFGPQNNIAAAGGTSGNVVTKQSADSAGAHTHTVTVPAFTGTSGLSGSGQPVNVMPPYTAVTFIIKT